MVKRGLGRGLGSLIPSLAGDSAEFEEIPVGEICPNQNQPRQQFDEDALADLVASINKHGVVQPIIVRETGGGYELIAGERRWRAAKEAGLASIPALIKKFDDGQSLQIALVENVQREDLNALEEALAYQRLTEEFSLTQAGLAELVGKNRTTIANTLRLLNLAESVQRLVFEERISSGHARSLLALEEEEEQLKLAHRIISEGLSVRQTEALVRVWGLAREKQHTKTKAVPQEIRAVARQIGRSLGVRVRAKLVREKIRIEIELDSADELRRIEGLLAFSTMESSPPES